MAESVLFRDVVLCNDAQLTGSGIDRTLIGEPMEGALLLAAAEQRIEARALRGRWTRVDETPFESESRRMVTVDRDEDGTLLEVVKGAPEVVLDMLPEGAEQRRGTAVAEELAGAGFRVLAVAHRSWQPPRGRPESLVLAGLVGIVDPPRTDAAGVVADCRDAGIRTVLITGDHPAAAGAVARDVGILVAGSSGSRPASRGRGAGRRQPAHSRRGRRRGQARVRQLPYVPALRDLGRAAEVLVILLGPFLGLPFPLGAGQILWINMLTHGVPGVAFGGEPLDPRDMRRPSPSPERSVLGGGLARHIAARRRAERRGRRHPGR